MTKLWNNAHHPEDVEKQCDDSLSDLGTDYLDLYLMHWPCAFARGESMRPKDSDGRTIPGDTDYVDTWKAMEKLVAKGKTKAIGVSNFSKAELERLIASSSTVRAPACTATRNLLISDNTRFLLSTKSSSIRTCNNLPSCPSTVSITST